VVFACGGAAAVESEILAGNLEALRARFPTLTGEINTPGEGAFAPGEDGR